MSFLWWRLQNWNISCVFSVYCAEGELLGKIQQNICLSSFLKKYCSKFTVRLRNTVLSLYQVSPKQTPKFSTQEFALVQGLSGKSSKTLQGLLSRLNSTVCMFLATSYAMLITFHIQRHHSEANQLSGWGLAMIRANSTPIFLFVEFIHWKKKKPKQNCKRTGIGTKTKILCIQYFHSLSAVVGKACIDLLQALRSLWQSSHYGDETEGKSFLIFMPAPFLVWNLVSWEYFSSR